MAFDLQQLEEGSNSRRPFIGGLDIAHLAKDKGVIKDARIGLADLCAKVLHQHLEKNPNLRVSSEWTNVTSEVVCCSGCLGLAPNLQGA